MTNPTNPDPTNPDPALSTLLDRLAAHDAATARPGMESRLESALTASHLRIAGSPQDPALRPTLGQTRSFFTAARLAAALLLAGGLLALYLARPTTTSTFIAAQPTDDDELTLAIKAAEPDNLSQLGDDLELLAKDAESLPSIADRDWTTTLLNESTL